MLGASCAIVTMRIACALLMTAQGALVPAVAELVWFVLLLWIALTSNSRYPLLLAAASLIGLLGSGLNLLDWVPYPPALAALVNASIALQGVCLMGAGIGLTRKPAHRTAQAL